MRNVIFIFIICIYIFNGCSTTKTTTQTLANDNDTIKSNSFFSKNNTSANLKCNCKITRLDSLENIYILYSQLNGNNIKILTKKHRNIDKKIKVGSYNKIKLKPLIDFDIQTHGLKGITFNGVFINLNENGKKFKIYSLF